MPPPRRTSLAAANRIFVDRTEPQIAFERAALHIPADRSVLLVYYGVGGQGKTALCRELLRKTDPAQEPSYEFLRRALLDLHGRPKTDPDLLLVWLRNAFAKAGVPTPCFDLAFAIVWDATRGEQELPAMESAWLARQKDVAGQVASEGFAKIGEAISEAATSVPVFGKLFSFAAKWSIRKGYEKYLHATREALAEMYDGAELKPAFELSQLLPWMLAQDLNHHLAANPGERFVLLIDEYERVFDQGGAGTLWRDNPFDRHVRAFVQETNGLLAVFFSRERLPWDDDPAWKDDLAGSQHLLGGLSDSDADDFLKAIPVADAALRAAMIAGARETAQPGSPVYPLMLDLQVEHWRELVAQNRQISPESFNVAASDFVARRNDIIKRVLRDYEQPMQSTLIRLACARRFDRATFEYAVREFYTGLSLDAFERLADLSFINRSPDGYLSFHGIVRDVLQEMLPKEERDRVMESLFEHFHSRASAESPRDITDAHVFAAFEASQLISQLAPQKYANWLTHIAQPIESAARYADALELWRNAQVVVDRELGPESESAADVLEYLAGLQVVLGNYPEAETNYEQALAIREKIFGATHPHTARALNDFAIVYQTLGDHVKAIPLHERALKIYEAEFGPAHETVAGSLENLAGSYFLLGEYERAKDFFERAMKIVESVEGPEHKSYAFVLRHVALATLAVDKSADVAPMFERALAILEKEFGSEHPELMATQIDVAKAYEDAQQFEKARSLFERVIEISQSNFGERHADTATALAQYGRFLFNKGDYAAAAEHFQRSASISEQVFGADHQFTARDLSALGSSLNQLKQFEMAETVLRRALAINERVLGPAHADTLAVQGGLAQALTGQGDTSAGRELYQRVLDLTASTLGNDHFETAKCKLVLGEQFSAEGDDVRAEKLYLEALTVFEVQPGSDRSYAGTVMNNLGVAAELQGDLAAAQSYYERALDIREQALGHEHPFVANSSAALGMLLCQREEYSRARPLLARALAIWRETPASDQTFQNEVRERLDQLEAELPDSEKNAALDIARPPTVH